MKPRLLLLLVGLAGLGAVAYWLMRPADPLPRPGSTAYEETVQRFYLGLASLEVGLLDEATTQFGHAGRLAPAEPAIFANLAVAHLRLGEDETAVAHLETARALAPESAGIALLEGLAARFGGRFDDLEWFNLMDRETHKFRSADEIMKILSDNGITPDKNVYTY